MAMSSRETEIKLAFSSSEIAHVRLRAAGARETHPRAFEDNLVFDLPGGILRESGRLLRLRQYGSASIVTFKGPVEGEHRHKVRIEHETAIANHGAFVLVLRGLGFETVYRYQKFRTTFALGDVAAALDETPLGTFVELEGAPDAIDRAAGSLGCGPTDYIRETYRELQETDAAARGVVAGELLITAYDPDRVDSP